VVLTLAPIAEGATPRRRLAHEGDPVTTRQSKSNVGMPSVISRQRIFISHSVRDAVLANELSRLLQTGLSLTSDNIFCSSIHGQGLISGQPVVESLWEKIHTSAIVIFLVSNSFVESAYCMCELGAVWGAKKRFLPILVPPMTYSDLPGVLSIAHSFTLSKDRDLDGIRDEIVASLPYLRRKGGFATWNNAKDYFCKEVIRLLSQFSPERKRGQDSVDRLCGSFQKVLKDIRKSQGANVGNHSFFVLMLDIDKLTQINSNLDIMLVTL
jgi:hypothetical protein